MLKVFFIHVFANTSLGPFSMTVKSVFITNANAACEYAYKDFTGDFTAIDVIRGGE